MGKDIHVEVPGWFPPNTRVARLLPAERSAAPLPSPTADWPEEARTSSSTEVDSVVTELVPGGYVARSMSATEAEARREGQKKIRDLLIGCTASQLHDIENAVKRIKDLSSDTEGAIDG